jgi:hypothetical protein
MERPFELEQYENLLRQHQEKTISVEDSLILNALITLSLRLPRITEAIDEKLAKEYADKNQ